MSRRESRTEWSIADLVDFEILLKDDQRLAELGAVDLRTRDSDFYQRVSEQPETTSTDKRFLFHKWLIEQRHKRLPDGESIGDEFVSFFRTIAIWLLIIGFVSTFPLVAVLTNGGSWDQKRPDVNITYFSWVGLIIPAVITILGLLVLLVQWGSATLGSRFPKLNPLTAKLPKFPVIVRTLHAHLLEPLVRGRAAKLVSQETALKAASVRGAIISQLKSRRGVLSACFAVWVQFFGLGYSLGLPVSTYLNLRFASHDFGWQTSLERSPERLSRRVAFFSKPWSWWKGEGMGYPSLEQVRETEYTKRDPMVKQPKDAWTAWSWFLILASAHWILVPRLLLFFLSWKHLCISLERETFDDPRYDPLFERMLWRPPAIWVRDGERVKPSELANGDGNPQPGKATVTEQVQDVCLLVVPEDLDEPDLVQAAGENIDQMRHWQITHTRIVPETAVGRDSFLREVGALLPEGGNHRVIIIDEVKNSAVKERTNFLKALRKSIGDRPAIVMALLGEPSDNPLGGTPSGVALSVWKKMLGALGDPRLRVITFEE